MNTPPVNLLGSFGTWLASQVRTIVVPYLVGLLVMVAVVAKVELDPAAAVTITQLLAFLYWLFVRLLEQVFPRAGWLLLVPRPPSYTDSDLKGLLNSAKRTFVPLLLGLGLVLAQRLFGDLRFSAGISTIQAALSTGVLYGAGRAVEVKRGRSLAILGGGSQPVYIPDNGETGGGDDGHA